MKTIRRSVLAVFAVLIATAFAGASTAAAAPTGFLAGDYPATLSAEADAEAANNFEAFGSEFICTPASFQEAQDELSTSLSAKAYDSEGVCSKGGEKPIEMNGCEITLDPESGSTGSVSIGSPGCGPIYVEDLFANCDVSIEPGAEYSGTASFENDEGLVNVAAELSGLKVTKLGAGCGEPTESASWSPHWQVTADVGGKTTSVEIADLPVGLFLAGEESEEESQQPRFEAESYPLAFGGEGLSFYANGGAVSCEESSLAGTISEASDQLALDASYLDCSAFGGALLVNVVMNSCGYTLTAENAGPPYSGLWGIACDEEGDAIEYEIYNPKKVCTVSVGSQSGLSGVSMANEGSGADRAIALDAAVEGISWQRSGSAFWCSEGSGSDGKLTGETTLVGEE